MTQRCTTANRTKPKKKVVHSSEDKKINHDGDKVCLDREVGTKWNWNDVRDLKGFKKTLVEYAED